MSEESNKQNELGPSNQSESVMDQEEDQDQPSKRRCSLRPRRSSISTSIVTNNARNIKAASEPPSNLVLSSSASKIKSRHATLETIFEEPLENGIRLFGKTKSKRSLILNGNITKMKIKHRKNKVKKMNLQKTIKRLKNKITFDDLQKKLNTLGLGL